MSVSILGNGAYSYSEAARLVRLKTARVREWFQGRAAGRGRKPVFAGDYVPVDSDVAVSFFDLVDVFIAGQLRAHGVPLQTLRRVYDKLREQLGTKHPFAHQQILFSGKDIFTRHLDVAGKEQLIHVLTDQMVFPKVLLPFLQSIDYEQASQLAQRWHIAESVVVDPSICFGKPAIKAAGIATAVLAAAYHANGRDADLVADWYSVHADYVVAAARFEGKMTA
jgi:uncharacterized protein (DUF433 family)